MIGQTPPDPGNDDDAKVSESVTHDAEPARDSGTMAKEYGGREGPDPTRYGDWEKNGRCIDF